MVEYVDAVASESDYLAYGPGDLDLTVEREREIVENYAKSENMIFLVGYIGDELVSIANFASSKRSRLRHRGELGMSVRKKYWRHGIGQAMLQALIDWAKGTGIIRKIDLEVISSNVPAIRLYEKLGFVKEGTIRRALFINGQFVDTHIMGLLID